MVLQRSSLKGMELPAVYILKSTNLVMHSKLQSLVSDAMKTYNDAKSKTLETKDKPNQEEEEQIICINYLYIMYALFLKEKMSLKTIFFSNFTQIN